jgi:uncharacterized protein YfaS (alpha-2-macroglobulin family)
MVNEKDNNSNQETNPKIQEHGLEISSSESETIKLSVSKTDVKSSFHIFKKTIGSVVLATIVIVAGVFFYNSQDKHVAIQQFTNVYSFVPEKISKSAPIQINLPDGVDEETARNGISFSPEVEGSWSIEEIEGVVVFEPKKPLKSGVYYAVNMDTGAVQMSGDFYVDEDPQVEAIFPSAGSESHEDSEITIVFNRPMVPLTTLTEKEKAELPITITPETPGKFKWISTRNLQFVPETTLIPSSDYTVEIKPGLYSLDGLAIAPVTHNFVTRPLRYEYVSSEQIGYRSPIIIDFNQPVDLNQSSRQISVSKQDGGTVSVEVEYGEVTYYDRESRKYVTESDASKLFIYQKRDTHGRSGLWDFDTSYRVTINGAVPLFGTKNLEEGKNSTVSVPSVVESVTAQSERSDLARSDLLDPEGTLTVTFYEDVDKDRSNINMKGLENVTYGERCQTDEAGNEVRVGSGCVIEDDKSTLIFSFEADRFATNESFNLELKQIETPDGFKINADPINIPLRTYPSFQILRTIPNNQSTNAALDGMYVCSNSPLKEPGEEGSSSYIETDSYIVHGRWSQSRYLSISSTYNKCNQGEFETNLRYGLLPETKYSLKLSLTDDFGQTANQQLAFTTEAPKEQYTRFHNMQKQYNVTPPERTTLTYAVENLEFVDLHICKLQPETFLERTVNRVDDFIPPQGDGCLQVVTENIALPARYFVNNYFQVNLADYFTDTRGHYVVTFSNPLYTGSTYQNGYELTKQMYDRTYVSVTNLAVGKKEVEYSKDRYSFSDDPEAGRVLDQPLDAFSNLFWVNNSQTLSPVNGASVVQFSGGDDEDFRRGATGFTNPIGVARVAVEERMVGAVVRSGLDSAVVTDWADTLQGAGEARDASRTYLYTDRPIYRPGHTVHIRGIDRIGFDGTYEVWNQGQAKLEVFDSQWNSVFETSLEMTDYGTFNTDFDLPSNAPLGTYRIEVFGNSSWFDVEEYVPAAFKLETEANQEEFVNGDKLELAVQADYYFGVPLSEGTVTYSVTAQDYYFDKYNDEYFNFGGGWYYCYYCGYGDDFLFRGEATLNGNGRAVIERELNFTDFFDDAASEGSKIVTVSITVKDINGRSVSSQKSFVVHKGDFYLGAKTDEYYTSLNTPVTFRVKTVDTAGQPVSLRGIERTTYKVNWETFKRQEVDGGFYYRSEKKLVKLAGEKINTNDQGDYQGQLTFSEEGQYEVHIEKEDERGNLMRTVSNIYIYGSRSVSVPPNNNYELDIEVERTDLDVGDNASLLIKSPYDTAKVLITVERGTVYDYWIADVKGGLYLHEFPIKSEYAPNIFVSALLLSPDPEIKHGSVRFEIGSSKNELNVEVTADKTRYLPGEEVTLQVKTRDNTGRAVPAEVSLAVADLSVLALKGNPKKNPTMFFYDGFPLSVTTASNIKNILYEVDIPLGTKGGGGGASPDDLASKKRGEFKDTAFWDAKVMTDQNGQATISFTLPDNLTTWQIEGLGVTIDTKLGVDYTEFTTKKDLMAVPLKPRFVVPGDRFMLGAKVFNQTDRGTDVGIKLESETLVFTGNQEDRVFINEGEEKTVYFEVVAPSDVKAGSHVFTFIASDETFIDQVEQTIAITPNSTFETVATANFTKADKAIEYLYVPDEVVSGEGGLTINANATMAVFMTDALSYMATYPYGSSEQLASSLSTIGSLTSALTIPNVAGEFKTIEHLGVTYTVDEVVNDGLSQVYETQTLNGGFAYYKGLPPNLALTMHVLTALNNLQKAGYEVRADVIARAVTYVEAETKRVYSQFPVVHQETVVLAEYVLREVNGVERTSLTTIVETLITDKAFLNEKISSMSLAYLAILTTDGFSRSDKNQVYSALTNRIDIDGRGAYLTNGPTTNRSYFETTTKNTALLLKVFAAHEDEHPAMANVLRWLLADRDNEGVWGGTHNTFIVVDSMIDYLDWQHETESHFTLRGLLDGIEILSHEFNPKNVFSTFTHFLPIDSLARQTLQPLVLDKENHANTNNSLYYDMTLKYFLPAANLPPRDEGITVERGLYKLDDAREQNPLSSVTVGDVVKGKLTLTIPDDYSHVAIEDIIPAGFEIINFNLDTEDQSLQDSDWLGGGSQSDSGSWLSGFFGSSQMVQVFGSSGFGGSYGNNTRTLSPTHAESHDDRIFLYVENMSAGVYEYEYFLRALVPGEFQHLPARAEELFFPEVFGRTGGGTMEVTLD